MLRIRKEELIERYTRGERDFSELRIEGCEFDYINLTGANLSGSMLAETSLTYAVLSGCDLRGIRLPVNS